MEIYWRKSALYRIFHHRNIVFIDQQFSIVPKIGPQIVSSSMFGFTIFVMVVFETCKWWRKDGKYTDEADIDNEISREIDVMLENIQNSL
uniref:Uncharacterized protein n=1 Tax=Magallana gigas TaxID=29159 RepID=A0A8W8N8W7_MAGGI